MSRHKSDEQYRKEQVDEIMRLKAERNAVIIVHNYQRDEIQDIADISGDSLALSRAAVRTDAKVIIFCGVYFMAESASILNPDKMVLLPVKEAGCPMADMVNPEKLLVLKKEYPDAAVVCYVNSSAEVKAVSDICCTSSNAIEIVRAMKEKRIIFIPDRNLGMWVQRHVPDKEIIPWKGFCPTHIRLTTEDVLKSKEGFPNAEFIAHPECDPEVLDLADHVCSTGGMFKYVKSSKAKRFLIGTESGMLYKLRNENPDKEFLLPSSKLICANMKLTTLGWVAHSLQELVYEVKLPEDTRVKAHRALKRMLDVTKEPSGAAITGY